MQIGSKWRRRASTLRAVMHAALRRCHYRRPPAFSRRAANRLAFAIAIAIRYGATLLNIVQQQRAADPAGLKADASSGFFFVPRTYIFRSDHLLDTC